MKVKRSLALIAIPQSINWEDGNGYEWRIDFDNEDFGLFATGSEKELFILPIVSARRVKVPRNRSQVKKAFRTFTDFEVERALEFSIPNDRATLKPLGLVTAIEYKSDKWTGRPVLYVHDYETPVTLYADRNDPERAKVFGLKSTRGKKLLSKRGLIQ
jgi:hypothetical protein